MDPAALAAAITGPLVGAVVGLGGLYFAHREGRENREQNQRLAVDQRAHERGLARDERIFAAITTTYGQCLDVLYKYRVAVGKTQPRQLAPGTSLPLPEELEKLVGDYENEASRTFASTAVVTSAQVAKALDSAMDAFGDFFEELGKLEAGNATDTSALDRIRVRLSEKIDEVERLMREDVRR